MANLAEFQFKGETVEAELRRLEPEHNSYRFLWTSKSAELAELLNFYLANNNLAESPDGLYDPAPEHRIMLETLTSFDGRILETETLPDDPTIVY